MRKVNLFALGLLCSVGALSVTGGPAVSQESIKIGVPTALTGTYAGLGNEAVRAVEFAA